MQELAPDVFQIPLIPRNGVNAYLIGDVLIDAGMKSSPKRIISAVQGHSVTAHALTHAHADHAGGSKEVTEKLGIPYWVPENDVPAAAEGRVVVTKPWMAKLAGFPTRPVDRVLREGDEVGGFTVLDTPGHSPGHVSYWRESDRTLICGDVFFHMNILTTKVELRQPVGLFTPDPARNRESERRLAELEPALVCFGHGPALRDPGAIKAFVAAL